MGATHCSADWRRAKVVAPEECAQTSVELVRLAPRCPARAHNHGRRRHRRAVQERRTHRGGRPAHVASAQLIHVRLHESAGVDRFAISRLSVQVASIYSMQYPRAMRIYEAKQIARDWVRLHGSATPGFTGAFVHGSVNWQPDDALLPATSDLDVMLVPRRRSAATQAGQVRVPRRAAGDFLPARDAPCRSPQQVLAEYNLAGSFHTPSVLLDPTGHLTRLQEAVAAEYAQRHWVRSRVANRRSTKSRPAWRG